jgi:hypothetical protein
VPEFELTVHADDHVGGIIKEATAPEAGTLIAHVSLPVQFSLC